jgi:exoribonuclease-2
MLPPVISEGGASLLPGECRAAVSFFATIDETGTLMGWEIAPSAIRSRTRVTYEQASEAVRGLGEARQRLAEALGASTLEQIGLLHGLATKLEAWRIAMGAHVIRAPEVDITVESDGTPSLKRLEGDDPGRILVSEMMILASRIAALFCIENHVPCIYRRQPPTDEPFPAVTGGPYDPVAVRRARRGLRRSESGLAPGRHFALGLDAYAQATSPIRRYQDLVIHRQIKSVLRGGPPCYDTEKLQGIAALTDEAERIARLAERGSDEYWTLKYLERRRGQVVEGIVVSVERRRVEVELCETLYSVGIAPRPDHELGQRLRFSIEQVNPRAAMITLRQLD